MQSRKLSNIHESRVNYLSLKYDYKQTTLMTLLDENNAIQNSEDGYHRYYVSSKVYNNSGLEYRRIFINEELILCT